MEAPVHVQKLDKGTRLRERKRKIRRARLDKPGRGLATVNGKPLDKYFRQARPAPILSHPLVIVNRITEYDLIVTVNGRPVGTSRRVRHRLAKALTYIEADLRPRLRRRAASPEFARRRAQKYSHRKARELPVLEALSGQLARSRQMHFRRTTIVIATPGLWDPGGSNPGVVGAPFGRWIASSLRSSQ